MFFRLNRFKRNGMDSITRNLSSEMVKSGFLASRSMYTLKHIAEWGKSKRRAVIPMCQHMEVWFINPLYSNGLYLIQIVKIKMELVTVCDISILYEITGHIFQILMFDVPKEIIFTLTNSSYPDECSILQHCIWVFAVC